MEAAANIMLFGFQTKCGELLHQSLYFYFQKVNENDGQFTIEFNSNEWEAQNLLKTVQKLIDVFEARLIEI